MWRGFERICFDLDLPFRPPVPFPQNSLLAARVAIAVRVRTLHLLSLSERGIGVQVIELKIEEGAEIDVAVEASFEGLGFGLQAPPAA